MKRNDPLKKSEGKLILEVKKRLKDLHNAIDVRLIDIHDLYSELQEMDRGDAC
ncbi:unnamed protein product [Spirodela intermedia]|uniref:Uncharacterized protein n=1 Tax=Spirodela intermedia TaxID=51605 RepID=A0A7I8J2H9_SPIIN|nr:unnamed protein product [Spirodela intermedia]CAA6664013.1 unnamed protein product [Spirodela intermedia]CAA6674158.1 unnamed protein product [Spirodela intermedia]